MEVQSGLDRWTGGLLNQLHRTIRSVAWRCHPCTWEVEHAAFALGSSWATSLHCVHCHHIRLIYNGVGINHTNPIKCHRRPGEPGTVKCPRQLSTTLGLSWGWPAPPQSSPSRALLESSFSRVCSKPLMSPHTWPRRWDVRTTGRGGGGRLERQGSGRYMPDVHRMCTTRCAPPDVPHPQAASALTACATMQLWHREGQPGRPQVQLPAGEQPANWTQPPRQHASTLPPAPASTQQSGGGAPLPAGLPCGPTAAAHRPAAAARGLLGREGLA